MKKIERKIKRKRIKAYLGRLLHSWPTKSNTRTAGPPSPHTAAALTFLLTPSCGPHRSVWSSSFRGPVVATARAVRPGGAGSEAFRVWGIKSRPLGFPPSAS
jgi:hypothetical protein